MYQNEFAEIYDILIQNDYSYSDYADYLEQIFSKFQITPNLIADLGCGTGSLCLELARRGYDMIGIDASPEMLNLAQTKAYDDKKNILFLNQSIHDFELFGTVGAIVSTIDSLNYILTLKKLQQTFKLADNYLDPDGLFIFDINSRYKLSSILANNPFYEITDDICYIWQNSYNAVKHLSTFELTFFVKNEDDTYSRFDEVHKQRAHSHEEIIQAAKAANLIFEGSFLNLTFDMPSATAEKICYVFRKAL